MDRCIMCGAPLPPDTRWAIVRWLNPKPPVCRPATEDCYRGLAASLGFTPTDEQVADALARARRVRG